MELRPEIGAKQILIFAKGITPDPGGIETYSEQISQAYANSGFGVTVISCFRGERGASERGAVKIVNVGVGRQGMVALRMVNAAMRYRRQAFRPMLIHATTWRAAVPALVAFPRWPLAITVHGREVTEMSRWMGTLMRFVFRRATRALVISHTTLAAAA